jgi:hypothetical protein
VRLRMMNQWHLRAEKFFQRSACTERRKKAQRTSLNARRDASLAESPINFPKFWAMSPAPGIFQVNRGNCSLCYRAIDYNCRFHQLGPWPLLSRDLARHAIHAGTISSCSWSPYPFCCRWKILI